MRYYSALPVICLALLSPMVGCTAYDPLPTASPGADAALSEEQVREIALEVAEEVALRVQQEAENRAIEERERQKNTTNEESQTKDAAASAAAAEEQAITDAVVRSEEAYQLLVPSERMRVDGIRERLAKVGLTRLEHEDIQWAWQGDGQDCLKAELLAAARKAQDQLEADTASLALSDAELIEFFCLEPLEQLRRLHLAQRFLAGDPIEEDVIIEFRRDPFMGKLVSQYMKGQQKASR